MFFRTVFSAAAQALLHALGWELSSPHLEPGLASAPGNEGTEISWTEQMFSLSEILEWEKSFASSFDEET